MSDLKWLDELERLEKAATEERRTNSKRVDHLDFVTTLLDSATRLIAEAREADRLRSLLREALSVWGKCSWAIPCHESQPDNPCAACQLAAKIRAELEGK